MKNKTKATIFFLNLFLITLTLLSYQPNLYAQKGNYSVLCVDRNKAQDMWAVVLNNDQSEKILDIVSVTSDTFPVAIINSYKRKNYIITSANYTGVPGRRVNLTLTKYENKQISQHVFYKTWKSLRDPLLEWKNSKGYLPTIAVDFNELKNNNNDSLLMMVAVTKGLKSLENVKQAVIRFERNYERFLASINELWKTKKRNIRYFVCTSKNYYAILQDESERFSQTILNRNRLTQGTLDSIYKDGREISALTSSPSRWYIVTERRRGRDQHTILSPAHYPVNGIQEYLDYNKLENTTPVFEEPSSVGKIADVRIHGLFIGVNEYETFCRNTNYGAPNLGPYCVNDADSMYKYFEKLGNLTQSKGTFKFLPDRLASKNNILAWAAQIGADAKENDMLIIYFSGHGSPGSFCAYDSLLSYIDLKLVMQRSKAKIKFVISDCCFAGSWDNESKSKTITNGTAEDFRRILYQSTPGYVQLFASKKNQVSLLSKLGTGNSLFTEVLLKGLRGEADNIDRDGMITIEEISNYLSAKVPSLSEPQYQQDCKIARNTGNADDVKLYCNNRQEPELKGSNDEIKKLPIAFLKK